MNTIPRGHSAVSDHIQNKEAIPPLDRTIIVGLMIALVFTILAHGAVEAWSVAIFEVIVTALVLAWAVKAVIEKRFEIRMPLTALPIVALLAAGLAQSLAWTDSEGRRVGLSMDIDATRNAVRVIFFLLVCFLIGANFFARSERLRLLANFLIVLGLALAVFSMIQHFSWDGRFYWLRPTARTNVFGPFVNRNHYAGCMAMLIPIPVGLMAARVSSEARLFYGFAAMMMGLSVVVSLSRGGMISLAAGMIFVLLLMLHRSRIEKRSTRSFLSPLLAFILVAVAIAAGIIWIGSDPIIDRIAQTVADARGGDEGFLSRNWMWRDTWAIFRARPLTGAGLGAFETVYPIYGHSDGRLVVAQSHNDYLQALADAGVVGGAAAVCFIALVFRDVMRGMRSKDPVIAGLAIGCGGGLFDMAVHSLFDFNLQIPSNALLFLLLSSVVSCMGAISAETRPAAALPLSRRDSPDSTSSIREVTS